MDELGSKQLGVNDYSGGYAGRIGLSTDKLPEFGHLEQMFDAENELAALIY